MQNLVTDCSYPLQCETSQVGADTQTGTIENVSYRNIKAANGVVSLQANRDFSIRNASISDVSCSLLRVRSGHDGGFNISNVSCESVDASQKGCNFSNIFVNFTSGCTVASWMLDESWANRYWLANFQDASIANMVIDGNGNDVEGLHLLASNDDVDVASRISNVVVRNISSSSRNAVFVINGSDSFRRTFFINCDFENNDASNVISGVCISSKLGDIDTSRSFLYSDQSFRRVNVSAAEGFSQATVNDPLNRTNYSLNEVHLIGTIAASTPIPSNNTPITILTIENENFWPDVTQYMHGIAFTSDGAHVSPCVISVNPDGTVKLEHISVFFSNQYNRISFDGFYKFTY